MAVSFPHTLKSRAETALNDPCFDFIAKYHAVADLRRLARKHPEVLDGQTIGALERLLQSRDFLKIRQAFFLFREAAAVLTDMIVASNGNGLGTQALGALFSLLRRINGSAHRGVAEALAGLPVLIEGPRLKPAPFPSPPAISWSRLLAAHHLTLSGIPRYIGRSLVVETTIPDHLLVVKLAKQGDTAAGLQNEIQWMETLKHPDYAVGRRFHVPMPLHMDHQRVFRIDRLAVPPPGSFTRHTAGLAIAFVAHKDYFIYPNHPGVDGRTAQEILGRNAFLMGWLAAKGVIHDAPIPLFHNRTQRLRREDQGRYQWFRSGRLDQWLHSCAFPNFGMSGLRDFEHLEPFDGRSPLLYRHIGSHLLSLLLVAGSYFRCRNQSRVGKDENGHPVDARDLFDPRLLQTMITVIFDNYFLGFTGRSASTGLPVDLDRLTRRMIDEMGVDRYMTELLRRVDQHQMTDHQFWDFLGQRGYRTDQLGGLHRGDRDILINSGPHLGDFNRQISLPELIEGVAAMAAVCIAGRFMVTALHGPG